MSKKLLLLSIVLLNLCPTVTAMDNGDDQKTQQDIANPTSLSNPEKGTSAYGQILAQHILGTLPEELSGKDGTPATGADQGPLDNNSPLEAAKDLRDQKGTPPNSTTITPLTSSSSDTSHTLTKSQTLTKDQHTKMFQQELERRKQEQLKADRLEQVKKQKELEERIALLNEIERKASDAAQAHQDSIPATPESIPVDPNLIDLEDHLRNPNLTANPISTDTKQQQQYQQKQNDTNTNAPATSSSSSSSSSASNSASEQLTDSVDRSFVLMKDSTNLSQDPNNNQSPSGAASSSSSSSLNSLRQLSQESPQQEQSAMLQQPLLTIDNIQQLDFFIDHKNMKNAYTYRVFKDTYSKVPECDKPRFRSEVETFMSSFLSNKKPSQNDMEIIKTNLAFLEQDLFGQQTEQTDTSSNSADTSINSNPNPSSSPASEPATRPQAFEAFATYISSNNQSSYAKLENYYTKLYDNDRAEFAAQLRKHALLSLNPESTEQNEAIISRWHTIDQGIFGGTSGDISLAQKEAKKSPERPHIDVDVIQSAEDLERVITRLLLFDPTGSDDKTSLGLQLTSYNTLLDPQEQKELSNTVDTVFKRIDLKSLSKDRCKQLLANLSYVKGLVSTPSAIPPLAMLGAKVVVVCALAYVGCWLIAHYLCSSAADNDDQAESDSDSQVAAMQEEA
jgi:hypothetical protein